jgi:hypothetical protein
MRHVWLLLLLLVTLFGAGGASTARAPAPAKSPFAEPPATPTVLAPGVISTGDDESHAVLAPDGTTLYFLKNSPNFDFWTIVTSRWQSGRWGEPKVAPFSGQWSDADPFLTEDGSKLLFISTRPVDGTPKQDTDLWMVERTASGGWGSPVNLASVNSSEAEWFPTMTRSGTLYFGSERPGGKGGADIWRSRRVGGVYQAPENVGELNTPAGEFEPMVSPDERFMVFAAIGRDGNIGAFDLWISYNRDGSWTAPEHLPPPINTPAWDFGPRLTPDGSTLLFTSSRAPGRKRDHALSYHELITKLHAPGNGLRDIYYVSVAALPTAPQAHPDTTGAAPE